MCLMAIPKWLNAKHAENKYGTVFFPQLGRITGILDNDHVLVHWYGLTSKSDNAARNKNLFRKLWGFRATDVFARKFNSISYTYKLYSKTRLTKLIYVS